MDKDLFDLDSFEASLSGFRQKLKEANDAEKANPDQAAVQAESDQASYADLDETTSVTRQALKMAI